MIFLATLPSANENFEYKSNPIPQPLHTYISGSAFFANLTSINKRRFKVKSEFKSLYLIYKKYRKFIIFGGLKVAFFFFLFKQLPLNIKQKFAFFWPFDWWRKTIISSVRSSKLFGQQPFRFPW